MDLDKTKVNSEINYNKVRVITDDGEQLGVLELNDALNKALERDLDLILVSDKDEPPVTKMGNFSKMKYEQKKKDKQRKNSQKQTTKEVKFRPAIDDNDFNRKVNDAQSFLSKKMNVKVSCVMKGREKAHKETGREKLNSFIEYISNYGSANGNIKETDNFISVTLSPK